MIIPTPSLGRIVFYVLKDGQVRPAIVVRLGPDLSPSYPPTTVNLNVQLDGDNDGRHNGHWTGITEEEGKARVAWRTSVAYSEEPKPGTWHWPPRVS